MSGFKRLPFLVLLAALTAPAARAQIAGHPVEASLNGGLIQYDARDHVRGTALGLSTLGYRWSTGLTFEYTWLGATGKRDATFGEVTHTFTWNGLDLRWNLRDPSERVTPYLLTGTWSRFGVHLFHGHVERLAQIARANGDSPIAYAIGSKQIYAMHYFDASLGLTFLVPDRAARCPGASCSRRPPRPRARAGDPRGSGGCRWRCPG